MRQALRRTVSGAIQALIIVLRIPCGITAQGGRLMMLGIVWQQTILDGVVCVGFGGYQVNRSDLDVPVTS